MNDELFARTTDPNGREVGLDARTRRHLMIRRPQAPREITPTGRRPSHPTRQTSPAPDEANQAHRSHPAPRRPGPDRPRDTWSRATQSPAAPITAEMGNRSYHRCDRPAPAEPAIVCVWHCYSAAGTPADVKAITRRVPRRDNRRDRDVAKREPARDRHRDRSNRPAGRPPLGEWSHGRPPAVAADSRSEWPRR